MKAIGWILVVIGGLSFLGAATAGDGVFGPCFCLGLGITLVCIAKQKHNDKEGTKEENKHEQ